MLTAAAHKHKAMQCDANVANNENNNKATTVRKLRRVPQARLKHPRENEAKRLSYAGERQKLQVFWFFLLKKGGT